MSTQTLTQRRTAAVAPASDVDSSIPKVNFPPVDRVPASKPNFTVGDIRRAIPAHCFARPLTKSFGYLFWDLALVGLIYYASTFIELLSDEKFGSAAFWLRHICWTVYWIVQGSVMTGLWVIGHECGHRGFADSELINDIVGLIVHSSLLVPYFSWQISHRRHHSNTGSVEHDEVFVPQCATPEEIKAHELRKQQAASHGVESHSIFETAFTAVERIFWMVVMLTLGWPSYLIANVSGNKSYDPRRWVSHFHPESPIFTTGQDADAKNQMLIVLSDVGLLAAFAVLYKLVQMTSLSYMMYVYFIPYLVTNFWLVLITYLQHTDVALPHYTSEEWDWLRGALATVDRDYGILNRVFHHIADTHVVHHLFSYMPHYHAEEATEAVKKLLGPYYRFDSTPVATALWNSFRDCYLLYPDPQLKGVHWFDGK